MKKPLLTLAMCLPALGQVYTPPPPSNTQPSTPSDTVVRSKPSQPAAGDKGGLLGNEIGVFDPTNDTATFNGKTWNVANNRIFEARFEKYLNEPENDTEAAEDYRKTIDEILDTLSPHREGGPDFIKAVALLPRASMYPGDSRLCDSLSNAIYTAIRSRKSLNKQRRKMLTLELEKQKKILDADWKARTERDPSTGNTSEGTAEGADSQQNQPPQFGRGANSLAYAEFVRRIAEIEATKKTSELEGKIKTELAKVQYQTLMAQFFFHRRFQHVIMASRFYNQIWSEGDGTLYIDKKSDLHKMFTESLGFSPTVSTLDSLANEAIRDVDKGVEVFSYLVERNELDSASKRLAEAYMVGEFMPSIHTLERSKKRKILEFYRGSNVLLNAINSKDYAKASEQIKTLTGKADDFDATRARAAVATFTRASDMHIMMAKNHLANRDMEKAQEEIRLAMETWPQNPKLVEFDRLVEKGGSMIQLRNDFDRLFAEKNYREVFKRQHELAYTIKDDPDRQAKFRQVLDNIAAIETAVKGAEKMVDVKQNYRAWEDLAEVHERFPDDPNLNQFMTKLAPSVADFTIAIEQAMNHEEMGNIGSALSWFYKAKHLHPDSNKAREGINRLVQIALQ